MPTFPDIVRAITARLQAIPARGEVVAALRSAFDDWDFAYSERLRQLGGQRRTLARGVAAGSGSSMAISDDQVLDRVVSVLTECSGACLAQTTALRVALLHLLEVFEDQWPQEATEFSLQWLNHVDAMVPRIHDEWDKWSALHEEWQKQLRRSLRPSLHTNPFESLLAKLSDASAQTLQELHHLRSARLTDLVAARKGQNVEEIKTHLKELQLLGLVVCSNDAWESSWNGAGVANWRSQKQLSALPDGARLPEPHEGENGQKPGPPCNEYRAAYFVPGYCWCGRWRTDHASEAVKAAEKLLAPAPPPAISQQAPTYRGLVYLAPSGKWSWKVLENDQVIIAGAGFSSVDEALTICQNELCLYDEPGDIRIDTA